MTKRKILWGICGIGTGHTYRQLPIVEHFVQQEDQIVVFAYGESLAFYRARFAGHAAVTVVPVSVPFYVGNLHGIDFAATARLAKNNSVNHASINNSALAVAEEILGKPDLIISDYEPVCAQYAYAHNAKLVTIDQQSKYLVGDFTDDLNGLSYKDEIARLKMFFPQATVRIACSFFQVENRANTGLEENVLLYPPILKASVVNLKRMPEDKPSVLVYISSQQDFVQALTDVIEICAGEKQAVFHIFMPKAAPADLFETEHENVSLYRQGDPRFSSVLQKSTGIVTTAGHTLLSEAIYLGIPAYVIPLPVYEQAMNGYVIDKHAFGMCRARLTAEDLKEFLSNTAKFSANIEADKEVLLRGQGLDAVIGLLENLLSK